MRSAEALDDGWLDQHQKLLSDFSSQIESCIVNSDWERLATVLDLRQKFLEQLLANPIPDCFLEAVKQTVASVLEQDAAFLVRVKNQKNISAQQQASLERGRHAIRAYNNS